MNVGGYFATLALGVDKKSFDDGAAGVKKIGEGVKDVDEKFGMFVKKSIQGLVALSAAAVGAGGAMSMIQAKSLITAQIAGMNTESYTNWANAMKLVMGNADGLDAGASKLQKTFTDIVADPQAYETLAKNLALISRNLNIVEVQKMSNAERIKTILDATLAQSGDQFKFSANRVGDIMGPEFVKFLYAMKEQGKTTSGILAEADSLRKVTTSSQQDAVKNASSINRLTVTGEQIGEAGLVALMSGLRPTIDKLTEWLSKNSDSIVMAMEKFGIVLGKILEALGPIVEFIGKTTGSILDTFVVGDVGMKAQQKFVDFDRNPSTSVTSKAYQMATKKQLDQMGGMGFFGFDAENTTRLSELLMLAGKDLTSNVTKKDIDSYHFPATIQVGNQTIVVNQEELKLAASLMKHERPLLPPFKPEETAILAAHMAVLHGVSTK